MVPTLFSGLRHKVYLTCAINDIKYHKIPFTSLMVSERYQQLRFMGQNLKMKGPEPDIKRQSLRTVTIPNFLTTTRICLTPVIGYLIWNEMHSHAMMCFAIAAVTDLLDGFIARRFNLCSRLGAILDPIADKFLLTTCFIALHHSNLLPLWLVGGFIGKDAVLIFGGALLRYKSFTHLKPSLGQYFDFERYPAKEFSPTYVSKCNTALQCLLIVTHLLTHQMTGTPTYDLTISALHGLTATTTIVSLGQYGMRTRKSISASIKDAP